MEHETIILHDVDGIARKSGTDAEGNQWTEFTVDAFADQVEGICSICDAPLDSGWLCLDGGEEVCDAHIDY